ncbi:MAG: LPS export ABC transporter permease LptF [Alphaproteobacteria bacterium]|nr:LPS export ABC transporter permease LptF [Alphaproteobacteria bacterium]
MGSIGRYIFRTTLGAFLLVLVSLTGVIWMTQALRDIDLMTSQGQTVLVFFGITGLIVPLLVLVIAPIALVIAVAHVLNKLGTDSEIIVMNGAGMEPWRLFKPFLAVTILVSFLVASISAYFAPEGLRMLRRWLTEVRTDLVSNIVQPGRFIAIERGLAFHIQERRTNGLLVGLMVDDRRDEKERVTILAERGEILKSDRGSFLVLEDGSIQRHDLKQRDPSIVLFDRYAFDLSQFAGGPQVVRYSIRERYLWQLMWPDTNDPQYKEQPGQFRAEFHDRILAPIYPFAFAIIAYAFLGAPRTTRQSRAWSVAAVIGCVAALRTAGFVSTVFGVNMPIALAGQYIAAALALGGGIYAISRGLIIEPPAFLTSSADAVAKWIAARAELVMRPAR